MRRRANGKSNLPKRSVGERKERKRGIKNNPTAKAGTVPAFAAFTQTAQRGIPVEPFEFSGLVLRSLARRRGNRG